MFKALSATTALACLLSQATALPTVQNDQSLEVINTESNTNLFAPETGTQNGQITIKNNSPSTITDLQTKIIPPPPLAIANYRFKAQPAQRR
jgi:hypothetical protein